MVCRCGAARPDAPDALPIETAPAPSGVPPVAIWGVVLAVIVGGGLWLRSTVSVPAPVTTSASRPTVPRDAAPAASATLPAARSAAGATVEVAPTSESMAAESAPASVPDRRPPAPSSIGVEDLVARATAAVVMVEAPGSRGTGFFVGPDLIVTNDHVVAGASAVTIRLNDGGVRAARVERTVAEVDLALLRTASATAPAILPLGQVGAVRAGQEVIAIGSALGLQSTVTRGIVSARRQAGTVALLQTDAAINPGNSGGPLLDRSGVVVGVTTLKIGGRAEGLGFAVAADHVRALVDGRPSTAVAAAAGLPDPRASAATASQSMPAFGATRSSVEMQREAGEEAYGRSIAAADQRARQIDGYWLRFRQACAPRPRTSGDREWFGVSEGAVEPTTIDQNCPYWLNDLRTMTRDFEAAVREAGDMARRAGVYPGTLRDLRRRHRLDWSGFER
jgi:S1-C subfamily serine protease